MRKLLLPTVVVAVAAALWFGARPEGGPDPGAREAGAPAAGPVAPAGDATPRARARATGSVPADGQPETDGPPAGADVPFETVAADESAGELLVLGPRGDPLPGVRVGFAPYATEDLEGLERHERVERMSVANVLGSGRVLLTGADGRVLVPKFRAVAVVVARHDRRAGSARLDPTQVPWTLRLRDVVPLAVRVRGASGAPCSGVRVETGESDESEWWPDASATTDAEGRAVFADLRVPPAGWDRTEVRPALPFLPVPRVTVDLPRSEEGDVEVVLPPAGSVVCEVVDDAGRAVVEPLLVRLRAVREAVTGVWESASEEPPAEAVPSAGAARFPWVGPGLRLRATVLAPDGRRTTVHHEFDGPRAPGDVTTVRLVAGGPSPVVTGRLVDGTRAPVAGTDVYARVLQPGGPVEMDFDGPGRVKSPTDADGRFRLVLDTVAGCVAGRKLQLARRAGVYGFEQIALADLTGPLSPSGTDLGEIRAAGAGTLLAGAVFDADGRAVEGATVVAVECGDDGFRTHVEGARDATTGGDGRFRIDGWSDAGRISVAVDAPGRYLPEAPEFAPGAEDVRIVLAAAGRIDGTLRLPEGLGAGDVRIAVRGGGIPPFGVRAIAGGLEVRPDARGAFEVPSLRPGRVDVVVQLRRGGSGDLAVIEDVVVSPGESNRDPRLQGIDLARFVRVLTVRATDEDGRPVADARAGLRPSGSPGRWRLATADESGRARFHLTPRDPPDAAFEVVVARPGRRAVVLRDVRADASVVLRSAPGCLVRIRLADDVAVPPPPWSISAALWYGASPDDEESWSDPRSVDDDRIFTDRGRVVDVRVADPGAYRVVLTLWRTEIGSATGDTLRTDPEDATVVVPGTAGVVEFVVRPDAKELAESLRDE